MTGGSAVVAGPARPQTGTSPPDGPETQQRRLLRRAPYVAPARVVAGTRHFDGRVENVGEGGMMLSLPEGLLDRESVNARFALPMTHTQVSVPATVVWRKATRPGMELVGLEFAVVDESMRAEIVRYVRMIAGPDPAP